MHPDAKIQNLAGTPHDERDPALRSGRHRAASTPPGPPERWGVNVAIAIALNLTERAGGDKP